MYLYTRLGTTGLNPSLCAINRVELAIRKSIHQPPFVCFDSGIIQAYTGAKFETEALKYQGITRGEIDRGKPPAEALREIFDFISEHSGTHGGKRTVVLSYKGDFDFKFLKNFYVRHAGKGTPFSFFLRQPGLDICSFVLETLAESEALANISVTQASAMDFFDVPTHPNAAYRLAELHRILKDERLRNWSESTPKG